MSAQNHVTNPDAIRTVSHRANLRRWQRSPRFKKMKAEHALVPGAVCTHCGRKQGEPRFERNGDPKINSKGKPVLTSLTINHLYEYLYLDEDLYLTWDPVTMEVCCTICNGWDRKGMEVCPVCRVNPIKKGDMICSACYLDRNPEIRVKRDADQEQRKENDRKYRKSRNAKARAAKRNHPCRFRMVSGACALSQIRMRCPYSKTKALKNCGDAEEKKVRSYGGVSA